MAVTKINKHFIGLSTDTKPDLSTTKVKPFTFFNEVDSGDLYVVVQTVRVGVVTNTWREVTVR